MTEGPVSMKFADFFEAMATAGIDYVRVGGWAVSLHGVDIENLAQLRDAAPPAP